MIVLLPKKVTKSGAAGGKTAGAATKIKPTYTGSAEDPL
jgi:hypothetical protein